MAHCGITLLINKAIFILPKFLIYLMDAVECNTSFLWSNQEVIGHNTVSKTNFKRVNFFIGA